MLWLLKSGVKRTFKNGKIDFFHMPKTCHGMCDIISKLALIQSLVVLLKIYEIENWDNVNSSVISPMLPKDCSHICILKQNVHFICGRSLNQHNNSTLQTNLT